MRTTRLSCAVALLATLFVSCAVPGFAQSTATEYCLSCHGTEGLNTILPSGETLSLHVQTNSFALSVHGQAGLTCATCHARITEYPHPALQVNSRRELTLRYYTSCRGCHDDEYRDTLDSIHLRVLAAGHREAPVCTDCHTAHYVAPPSEPRFKIDLTCAACHQGIFDIYKESAHGEVLARQQNNLDVPVCTNCHGVHRIEDPRTQMFRLRSPQLCAACHANKQMMSRYGLSTAVFRTYVADFHGTTTQLFKLRPGARLNEAVCYDCHGTHNIKRVEDPDSPVIKQNLLRTCQQCHPTANVNLPASWLKHYEPSPAKYPLVYYVTLFYKIAIPLIVGGFVVLIVLDLVNRVRPSQVVRL